MKFQILKAAPLAVPDVRAVALFWRVPRDGGRFGETGA